MVRGDVDGGDPLRVEYADGCIRIERRATLRSRQFPTFTFNSSKKLSTT